jgi:predicted aconitase with swiveling domain
VKLHGRPIYKGRAEGEALVTSMPISFFGGVDPDTGTVVERGHELEGQSIAGRVLVFPTGRGSTVGSYTLFRLARNQKAPVAIVNVECETITAVGCIISGIPCVDRIAIDRLETGMRIAVDGDQGTVEVSRSAPPRRRRGSAPGAGR